MKIILSSFLMLCAASFSAFGQVTSELSQPPDGDNQRAEVSQWIGPVKITIDYHSPRVHLHDAERTGHIWGELIPYGFNNDGNGSTQPRPWRAGANENTTITVSHDVKIQGKTLKAGTYGLFLDLEKTGPSNWIFSSDSTAWGAYQYDPKDDVLRLPTNLQDAPFTEFLTYGFDERLPDSAVAFLQWENKRVPFKIDVPDVYDIYAAQLHRQLQSWPGFFYQDWQTAAQFCADHKVNLEEALTWADKAIKEPFRGNGVGREDYSTLQTKAAVLDALGRTSDADATMDRALHLPGTEPIVIEQYGVRLLHAGRKDRAMEIFKFNQQQHPDDKFYVNAGLARGYTALGDKANAIKCWETALQNVPDSQKVNRAIYEKALKDVRDKE